MSHHFDTRLAKEDPSLSVWDLYWFAGAPGRPLPKPEWRERHLVPMAFLTLCGPFPRLLSIDGWFFTETNGAKIIPETPYWCRATALALLKARWRARWPELSGAAQPVRV